MSKYDKTLVDIPEDKGVHVKTAGNKNEKYVYKHVKYFRNANGAPRNKSKAIGKLDTASGRMYPNGNYYRFTTLTPHFRTFRFGITAIHTLR